MHWRRSVNGERTVYKKPTGELDKQLAETKPGKMGEYLAMNRNDMADGNKGFYYYYKDVLDSKHIMLKDVYKVVGVSESYGSKIISMEKHTSNRDLIIRFCLAGHFSLDEMNRALKLYGLSSLYAKNQKDACVIVAVNNHIYDVDRINEILSDNNLEKLN